ncbi:MAG TPA: hypothetical protein VEX40_17810 [Mycobacterium sp.]|nr:hypothetical protein [Mycobacterium sp.]
MIATLISGACGSAGSFPSWSLPLAGRRVGEDVVLILERFVHLEYGLDGCLAPQLLQPNDVSVENPKLPGDPLDLDVELFVAPGLALVHRLARLLQIEQVECGDTEALPRHGPPLCAFIAKHSEPPARGVDVRVNGGQTDDVA